MDHPADITEPEAFQAELTSLAYRLARERGPEDLYTKAVDQCATALMLWTTYAPLELVEVVKRAVERAPKPTNPPPRQLRIITGKAA